MVTPSPLVYSLYDSAFGYRIVDNPNFKPGLISSNDYNNEMPYLLLPALTTAVNFTNLISDLDDAFASLDTKNANKLSSYYYDATQYLKKIKRNPLYALRISRINREIEAKCDNILKNINNITKAPEAGEFDDIIFFAIKKHIPLEDKLIIPEIYIYPELNETPWYLHLGNSFGDIFVQETKPKLKGYYLSSSFKKTHWETEYYPEYHIVINSDIEADRKIKLILHRKNGKRYIEGVLDSYSTSRILFTNKESLIKRLKKEKNKIKIRSEKISQIIGEE